MNARQEFLQHLSRLSDLTPIRILLCLSFLLMAFAGSAAENADTRYLRIFNNIEKADRELAAGQTNAARTIYQEAQSELLALKRQNPNWNSRAVTYRLNYVTGKIASLSDRRSGSEGGSGSGSGSGSAQSAPDEHGVRLLNPGSEPRRTLRYQVEANKTENVRITVNTTMDLGAVNPGLDSVKMPAIEITARLTTRNVLEGGDIEYEMVLENCELRGTDGAIPQMVEGMKAQLEGAKGSKIRCTMSPRGVAKNVEVDLPAEVSEDGRQFVEQLKESVSESEFVLPEQSIGAGARWEVHEKAKSFQGVPVDQTTTYTLVSMDEDRIEISSTQVQRASGSETSISHPMAEQFGMRVTRLTGSGTSSGTVDLTRIFPTRMTIDSQSELTMRMESAGQSRSVTMRSQNLVRLESN